MKSSLSERLIELRKQRGLSQRNLAAIVNLDVSYISKLETGVIPVPNKHTLLRLAEALNADKNELLSLAGIHFTTGPQAQSAFGSRLKTLRLKAGLTQKQLADKSDINYSYISKIERDIVAPPRREIVLKLAKALKANRDELLVSARYLPQKEAGLVPTASNPARIRASLTESAVCIYLFLRTLMEGSFGMFSTRSTRSAVSSAMAVARSRYSVILPVLLVIAVVGAMIFASPAQAITVSVSPTAGSGTLGSTYIFTVTVQVDDIVDELPIQTVDLLVYNGSSQVRLNSLPIPSGPSASASQIYNPTNGGTFQVTGQSGTYWGYGDPTGSRTGYGYGYTTRTFGYQTYTGSYGYGYGYGYDYIGTTTLTYTVIWTVPTNWTGGVTTIRAIVYGDDGNDSNAVTNNVSASVNIGSGGSASLPGGGGSTTTTTTTKAGTTDVSDDIDTTGKATKDIKIKEKVKSQYVKISILKNTIAKDAQGNPLTEITVSDPTSPAGASGGLSPVGQTFEFGPTGTTFDPPASLSLQIPNDLPAGVAEEDLVIGWWDEENDTWVILENITIADGYITADVSHFTEFAVIARTNPANIVASDLSVTPAEIAPGESVIISFKVTNTGDLTGQEDIALLINGVETSNNSVTLNGGEEQTLEFSTTRVASGTYEVSVLGQKGTFTVTGAASAPTSTPTVEPTSPAPTTPAATTPASTTPAQTPPEPEPMNWVMIILIAIAAIIVVGILVWYAMRNMR